MRFAVLAPAHCPGRTLGPQPEQGVIVSLTVEHAQIFVPGNGLCRGVQLVFPAVSSGKLVEQLLG